MHIQVPQSAKVLAVRSSPNKQKPALHDAVIESRSIPPLKPNEVLVRIGAVAFNHRELWIRKGLYPNIGVGSVYGADGAGTVVASGRDDDTLLEQRVFMTPTRGWTSDPDAPESPRFGVIGGVAWPPIGTFAEYVVVDRDEVIPSPKHLDDVHISAWPVAGVTAWRAAMIYAKVESGHNVLITGIGGGVALIALQLCIAKGASVYVTSGSQEKIARAIEMGAKGGANYKDKNWPKQIAGLVQEQDRKLLDSVIDSGGGEIMTLISKNLKFGGRVVCYGMTASPKISFTMREVMMGQRLLGSMMGSTQDLKDATDFLSEHRIVPVVSHVLDGLEAAEEGFELMERGDQFGKIVIQLSDQAQSNARSKL